MRYLPMRDASSEIRCGDSLEMLRRLPDASVHCCVTSPPYWGLRTYKTEAQIGLEHTVDEYVARIVAVFREVRRVLRNDGSLWLNLGDTYTSGNRRTRDSGASDKQPAYRNGEFEAGLRPPTPEGLKAKDLVGLPWRVAFALQADGYLRNDAPWMKMNCTPSSVRDKLTVAHEYLFLLTKAKHYFYDIDAAKKPSLTGNKGKKTVRHIARTAAEDVRERAPIDECTDRQRRTSDPWRESLDLMIEHLQAVRDGGALVDDEGVVAVLSATNTYRVKHFACFPPALVEPCVLSSTSERGVCWACGAHQERVVERTAMVVEPSERRESALDHGGGSGRTMVSGTMLTSATSTTTGWKATCTCGEPTVPATVLDPFNGAGTTGLVAARLGRSYVGIDINPEYCEIARRRIEEGTP